MLSSGKELFQSRNVILVGIEQEMINCRPAENLLLGGQQVLPPAAVLLPEPFVGGVHQ